MHILNKSYFDTSVYVTFLCLQMKNGYLQNYFNASCRPVTTNSLAYLTLGSVDQVKDRIRKIKT